MRRKRHVGKSKNNVSERVLVEYEIHKRKKEREKKQKERRRKGVGGGGREGRSEVREGKEIKIRGR